MIGPNTPYWDLFWIGMAKYYSAASKDPSTKAGAVIVRPDNTVVSMGHNGFPRRMRDDPSIYANREQKYSRIVHAEMNALLYSKENTTACSLYIWPFMSCEKCAIHIIQAGINRVVSPECPEHLKERWAETFARSRSFYDEAGVAYFEYSTEECSRLPSGPHREPGDSGARYESLYQN